ncbi:MAG: HipA domain-containing protein [Ilumatobacter sp.]|uniref:HipA domain-containing protein n=1 Tax=Ilumatobacter sp. TaxID=1967498 RepID=UPI003C7303C8
MTNADQLVAWLDETPTATIERSLKGIRLNYTDHAIDRWGLRQPILSCSLLTSTGALDATAFVDGLLPEGDHRRALAERADVRASDLFGLIARYGRDIAGAVQFLPSGDTPDEGRGTVEPLDHDDLERLVDDLDRNPLALTDESELSLPGVQNKMLLVAHPDNAWGRPLHGQPSTHILKRDHPRHVGIVAAEHEAMRLARHVGLTTVDTTIERYGDYDCLIVSRFDRTMNDGVVTGRIHQEDACQALGRPARDKYEIRHGGGGPELVDIAHLLDLYSNDPSAQLDRLATYAAFAAIIGNADAHGKNYALLLEEGTIELAPLYDQVPTSLFPKLQTDAAMSIGGGLTLDAIGREAIEREARMWNHDPAAAGTAASNLARELAEAVEADVVDPTGPLAQRIATAQNRF